MDKTFMEFSLGNGQLIHEIIIHTLKKKILLTNVDNTVKILIFITLQYG